MLFINASVLEALTGFSIQTAPEGQEAPAKFTTKKLINKIGKTRIKDVFIDYIILPR